MNHTLLLTIIERHLQETGDQKGLMILHQARMIEAQNTFNRIEQELELMEMEERFLNKGPSEEEMLEIYEQEHQENIERELREMDYSQEVLIPSRWEETENDEDIFQMYAE